MVLCPPPPGGRASILLPGPSFPWAIPQEGLAGGIDAPSTLVDNDDRVF